MDIAAYEKVIATINAILENRGIAEIKIESGDKLVVVDVGRMVKHSEPIKEEK